MPQRCTKSECCAGTRYVTVKLCSFTLPKIESLRVVKERLRARMASAKKAF